MNLKKTFIASAMIAVMIAVASLAQIVAAGQQTANSQWMAVKRKTLAIRYKNNDSTTISMAGSAIVPRALGKAEIKNKDGSTRIKLEMANLGNPQAISPYYTAFVLWAVAPEGQADNLAELSAMSKIEIEVTTHFQTFGLIITAEPHSVVKLPSPAIVSENALRKGTEGSILASSIEYSSDPAIFYEASSPFEPPLKADYDTPLLVLGARRAIEIARSAGANRYAETELREAAVQLESLERIWPEHRKDQEKYSGAAHDIMRIAENARTRAVERDTQSRLADERSDAVFTIASAQNEADRAQNETDKANRQAAADLAAINRAQIETAVARTQVEQAQNETNKAKSNEELARAEATGARLETQVLKKQQSDARQRLYISLSEILETRQEARGLIVNLSDVLFDFNQATLKPDAREKLSKLAGILLAYPGAYRIQIEGHTDSVGSQDYNQKLSEDRAEAVHAYLIGVALSADSMVGVRGFGKIRPVATNDTPEGRQTNRRVEIVISDIEK